MTNSAIHGHSSRGYSDVMDAPKVPSPRTSPDDVSALIFRGLPMAITEQSIRSMLLGANKDIVKVIILGEEQPKDSGLCAAVVTFNNEKAATATAKQFNNRLNVDNTAQMIVEVLSGSSDRTSSESTGTSPVGDSFTGASTSPMCLDSLHATPSESRAPSSQFDTNKARFYGQSLDDTSRFPPTSPPTLNSLRTPQLPAGGRVAHQEPQRVSGKELIQNAFTDEEANEILNERSAWHATFRFSAAPTWKPPPPITSPPIYEWPGFHAAIEKETNRVIEECTGRRATAPQIPISAMNNLTLNSPPAAPTLAGSPDINHYGSALASPITPYSPTGQSHRMYRQTRERPPGNLADQFPPCNTLYVGNIPDGTHEEDLKALFSKQKGYKRLCYRVKTNGPMCFVEFDTISYATKALNELHGYFLQPGNKKGGIRLSFSKNPLGVRSNQNPANGVGQAYFDSFATRDLIPLGTAQGPPPGLGRPPGLTANRFSANRASWNPEFQPFTGQGYNDWHARYYGDDHPQPQNRSNESDCNNYNYNNNAYYRNGGNDGPDSPDGHGRHVRFPNTLRWN